MEGAHKIAQLAIRTCGGQAMLKSLALERIFRDSRLSTHVLLVARAFGAEKAYYTGDKDTSLENRICKINNKEEMGLIKEEDNVLS